MDAPDPRPRLAGSALVVSRCRGCARPSAVDVPGCPACGDEVVTTTCDPVGTVWAATTVHVPTGDLAAPYGLAYLDVDDGPRVLVHTGSVAREVGARLRIGSTTARGDLFAAPEEEASR